MKTAGIIRSIDSLGRLVLPKEMRKANGITEDTPLEIIPGDDGDIIIRKYNPHGSLMDTAKMMAYHIYSQDISLELAESLSSKLSEIVSALQWNAHD